MQQTKIEINHTLQYINNTLEGLYKMGKYRQIEHMVSII